MREGVQDLDYQKRSQVRKEGGEGGEGSILHWNILKNFEDPRNGILGIPRSSPLVIKLIFLIYGDQLNCKPQSLQTKTESHDE